ncbi:hypothetical protein NAEGRDRAFT_78730 [Naegleria gruberi]|uniref:Uncharacterized protein n=1 Tax=Naegleria gruberi TaxID=5762 RepID=D2V627_NAEGR|nr:uncharacterized protein NAEGRDRAFT_78730 [Naegleria gruberi]EFC47895.1 hypothetical protein NAEGRDRAFT_78730 [Naegleria gruberi]|eukprot:XP_002680639.1 hypothetical protein NAEGRDRAFT_78730 [Naegleria gruberi strain NEG-M]
MKRDGVRFNVASNQTIKKCPLCTSWKCRAHASEINIKERYNNDKEYRKDINKNLKDRLAVSIHGHLIEKDHEVSLCSEVKHFEERRFVSGFISRNVGYCRKDHKKNYEMKDRKDFRQFSRFGKYYQKKLKLDDL